MNHSIPLGISACLLGEPVRYDGQDKHLPWATQTLVNHFQLIPVCPEVGAGLGVPRPPVRLVQDDKGLHLLGLQPGLDVTTTLAPYCSRESARLATVPVAPRGFLFKSRSPSCAMGSAPVFNREGTIIRQDSGLFARAWIQASPLAVVVEETDLQTEPQRRHFIERVFVLDRWMRFVQNDGSYRGLSTFQARHKMQIMAHDREAMQTLGRLASGDEGSPPLEAYGQNLMRVLAQPATLARQVDCLMHLYGFMKTTTPETANKEFLQLLETVRLGQEPVQTARSWLQHWARSTQNDYVLEQWYLFPDPREAEISL
ncbi:MAG: DUF523 and DUF1722 domain-containing protein [Magnetococcales bacterium]|nr:DUF523 and DUF1722 domain-containing protein [Magnetococcales bacterium]